MSSRPALAPRPAAPAQQHAAAAAVQPRIRKEAPANDDERAPEFSFYGDPLLGMALASIVMLIVLAALMTMS